MFCFRCGASMPDDAKVCPQCAAPVEAAPPPPAQQPQTQQPQTQQPQPSQQAASPWLNVPPAPAQYPQGQPYAQVPPYQQQPPTDGKATASLVCGILSILCFSILTGIPAIILGHISRGNIQRSGGRLQGGGMALAGLILGYASLAVSALVITAIMIPNLLRARISANESAAMSTVRNGNVNCNYVVVATPVSSATGTRSFCSTADAIVRQRFGAVSQPISIAQCSSWPPTQLIR